MKILVTGAAGFLGSAMVRRSVGRGHETWGLVRSVKAAGELGVPREHLIEGSLPEICDDPRLVEGMDGVIHCAAVTSAQATDSERSQRVNVEGTRRLLAAAHRAGVARWVQISSMSAHAASTSVYGRTKLQADEILRQSTPPPQWTILRPSLIYGPGERGLVAKTLKIMKKLPVLPIIGSGRELIRPVFVDDVADAALDCLNAPATVGQTYMIGGAQEVTLNEFMKQLGERGGVRRPLFHLPIFASMTLARAAGMLVKNPPLTVDNVLGVREARRVDQEPAQRDWGYAPLGLDEGLTRTFETRSPA